MTAPVYERDFAHEADMRELQRKQLRGDFSDEDLESEDQASIDNGDWGDGPTKEERAEYDADLDAQEAQYAFQQSQYWLKKVTA